MRYCIVVTCLLFTWHAAAAGVQEEAGHIAIRQVTVPQLVVFCNKTQQNVLLERLTPSDSAGMGAGWSSELKHFGCSVFFADHSPIVFTCRSAAQRQDQTPRLVDCAQYVLAARFPWSGGMLCGTMPSGNYWVAEAVFAEDLSVLLRHHCFDV